ncbi:DUF2637 domain-containing protein [Streptomyces sp. NPDC048106]|uniref:DUF2637 domain-containing protein n=1 Tax=Streptomyces sp. NPDC048106 TaxID=3155750 RepID=UPI0034565255
MAVVLMAFRVSWNALSDVARAIGADVTAALLYPIVVDGLMALALVATLVLTGSDRKFALRVLATYTLASLLLNYVHGLIPALHTESARWGRLADWAPGNYALVLLATSLPVGSIYFGSDLVAKVLHHSPVAASPAMRASDPATSQAAVAAPSRNATPVTGDATLDVHQPTRLKVAGSSADVAKEAADVAEASATSVADAEADMDAIDPELLALARRAPRGRGGKASRRHIEDVVRSTGRTIGKDEAERVKDALQAELDEAAAAKPGETAPTTIAS